MPLGLMVAFAMLSVITVLGALGYLIDRQVDRGERKDGHK
jgi:hypothetical protein